MNEEFYITGGTLPLGADSYVYREADTQLLDALRLGEFCYVLNTRQIGKSSLMIRTARRLEADGRRVAILDLTAVGRNLSIEQWYYGLLKRLGTQLGVLDELTAFWKNDRALGPLQRFLDALQETLRIVDDADIVIFIDEIDVIRSLPFPIDEFFGGIRECCNHRVQDPAYFHLTFCLLGVAAPADLIQDTRISPFNIGRRIELRDFTPVEAAALAPGLPQGLSLPQARRLLNRVLHWTNGHPYMTQLLCRAVVTAGAARPEQVDGICQRLFLSASARDNDDNLAFVRNRLLRSEADLPSLLSLFARVLRGEKVFDDETNPLCAILRLSGIVRADSSGRFAIRNRIYACVFDRAWIDENMPDADLRRQRAAYRRGVLRTSLVAGTAVVVMAVLSTLAVTSALRANRSAAAAQNALETTQRTLYDSQIDRARSALAGGHPARALSLLETLCPTAGQKDLREFTFRLLNGLAKGQAVFTYPVTGVTITQVNLSRDGRYLAACTYDHKIVIINVIERRVLTTLSPQTFFPRAAIFTPDGRFLVVMGYPPQKPKTEIWDWRSGKRVCVLDYTSQDLRDVFSPDGRTLALVGGDAKASPKFNSHIVLLHAEGAGSFKELGAISSNSDDYKWELIAFSPDGRTLIVPQTSGGVHLYNALPPYQEIGDPGHPLLSDAHIYASAVSPDGRTLAVVHSVTKDPTKPGIELWDIKTHRPIGTIHSDETLVGQLAFTPDGRYITEVGVYDGIRIWNVAERRLQTALYGSGVSTSSIVLSPDGKSAWTSSIGGAIREWNIAAAISASQAVPLPQSSSGVNIDLVANAAQRFSISKKTILDYDSSGWAMVPHNADFSLAILRDPADRRAIVVQQVVTDSLTAKVTLKRTTLCDPGCEISPKSYFQPQFTNDPNHVWAISIPSSPGKKDLSVPRPLIRRWNLQTGRADAAFPIPWTPLSPKALTFDPRTAIVGVIDTAYTLHWLDMTTGQEMLTPMRLPSHPVMWEERFDWFSETAPDHFAATMPNHDKYAWYLSPDRRHLLKCVLSAGGRGVVTVCDTRTKQQRVIFDEAPGGAGVAAEWAPSGRFVYVFVGGSKRCRRYDLDRDAPSISIDFRSSWVWHYCIAGPGSHSNLSLCAIGLADGSVQILDMETGRLAGDLRGDLMADAVAVSADGRTAAIATVDHTITLWNVQTGKMMTTLPLPADVYEIDFCQRDDYMVVYGLDLNFTVYRPAPSPLSPTRNSLPNPANTR